MKNFVVFERWERLSPFVFISEPIRMMSLEEEKKNSGLRRRPE